jgi:NAD(P)-dependent dehydrogenase (short-subunit alcohol dehydrogenase family)
MMTSSAADTAVREPALLGQTVVVIGGSSGIGLETARNARAEGAELVLNGLDRGRLEHAAALAVHIMTNTALTGATYNIDGGGQLVPA